MVDTAPLTFIGFGEAAQAFCEGWGDAPPAALRAHDVKSQRIDTAAAKRADFQRFAVAGYADTARAVEGAGAVISVVTADQALIAARAIADAVAPGTLVFDCNSVAPGTKQEAARLVEAAGGRYVDVAVMAPVRPALLAVPLLIAGPHAAAGHAYLTALGFRGRVVGDAIGAASAIKMIRSIMIKGLEALTAECLLSARAAGLDEEVVASLDESFPGWDWRTRGDYNLDRMLVHGTRRAAEMRESALTAAALGQTGSMAAATADWQQRLGALGLSSPPEGFAEKADAILAVTGTPLP
jgi:3-hydroxyisobutyrate dehydrogenase-like beta-hydroxyacid dehydrogenase